MNLMLFCIGYLFYNRRILRQKANVVNYNTFFGFCLYVFVFFDRKGVIFKKRLTKRHFFAILYSSYF